jgi:hypothetical protein
LNDTAAPPRSSGGCACDTSRTAGSGQGTLAAIGGSLLFLALRRRRRGARS